VNSVLVLTDGYINILDETPPYRVLWGLLGQIYRQFNPPYGQIVEMDFSD
jgi:hypothetical protein